ncbi:cystatin [Tanacetum coccineum]
MITLLLLFNIVFLGFSVAEQGQKTIGNWLEIASPDDPVVIEVGKFAIEEYNKDSNSTLKFGKVINGHTQIVGGMNWRLTIEVVDSLLTKDCEVFVFEQPRFLRVMHVMHKVSKNNACNEVGIIVCIAAPYDFHTPSATAFARMFNVTRRDKATNVL